MRQKSIVVLNNKGFTLIELLVGLALSTLVVSGLMSVYWLSHYAFIREQSQADIQYSVRQVRDHLVKDIRACKKVEVWTALNAPVSSPSDTGSWLSLQIETNGSIQIINYYVASGIIYRHNTSTHPQNKLPVASNIESISFISPKPTLINFTINARASDQVYSLSGSMSRRVD